jgi:hypothetical protein
VDAHRQKQTPRLRAFVRSTINREVALDTAPFGAVTFFSVDDPHRLYGFLLT